MTIKNMTLRLSGEQAADLDAIARIDEITVSDAVREAITEHIERRRNDAGFRERLQRFMDEEREVLERLAR